jgi:uncharacterized membrane protein HdeD (DUF308 family)
MQRLTFEEADFVESASSVWWVFLITGIAWLWVSLIILRLNATSITAVSIMFGVVAIAAGVNELIGMSSSTTGWKIARAILGVLFIIAGIVAFFQPAGTFVALASLFAWVVLFKGIFDVTLALVGPKVGLWWLILIVGILEILLAFWVAGSFERKVILLVAYVGIIALSRGITELILAFKLKGLRRRVAVA